MKGERLVVGQVEGIGQNLLDQKGQFRAFMGSSLNRGNFFTREHLSIYFHWALEQCSNFLFVIDDWEERNNYRVFKGLEEETATNLALQVGKERAVSAERVVATFAPSDQARLHISRTSELFQDPKCIAITSQLWGSFHDDPKFKDDVDAQVFMNIGSKLADWRKTVSGEVYLQGLSTVSQYLIEEIGATTFIREDLGYPIEIYSSPVMKVMQNLYQGNYPDLSRRLGLKAPYGYIQLDIESIKDTAIKSTEQT
jgi:tRNA-dependent cyclodipeptide synthase